MLVWEIDDQMLLVAESAGSVTSHSVTQEAVSKSQHLDSKAPIVSQGDWLGSLSHSLSLHYWSLRLRSLAFRQRNLQTDDKILLEHNTTYSGHS